MTPPVAMTEAEKAAAYDAGLGQSKQELDKATNFDIKNFEELLTRLEASKGRQQRQKSLEGRRDIFATGLGSMMSNF